MTSGRLTTRLSYTASEVAGQLIFCVISFYLLKFYTDVYGISAAAAGSVLLIARCVDAVDAPLWGIIFEKTRSRYGRSRPWFLWLCVPFALFGALTFVTPSFSGTAKVVFAATTYVVSSILYTGINTPVTSVLCALTPDSRERVTLTTFRMFGSKFGVLFVNLTVLRLVHTLGGGNDRKGFAIVMSLYALGSVALFLTAFRNLREVVQEYRPHLSVRSSLSALKGNGPWSIIFVSSLFFWIAFIARISAGPFFFQYVLHRPDLISIANTFDFVSLGSIFCMPWLARRFSKRSLWASSLIFCALSQLVVFAGIGGRNIGIVLTGWALGFFASGIAMAMPFSLLSDSVDFGEWKSGVRAAGLLTAIGAAFCLKAGAGLGAAMPAWILGATGYVANTEQHARALGGIVLGFVWLPAAAYVLATVPVLFYHRYERMEPVIQRDLQVRRALAAAASASV